MRRFAAACTGGGRPSVARVTTAARRLADKRHYAETEISSLAHRLERAYKQLSAGDNFRSLITYKTNYSYWHNTFKEIYF